MEVLYEDNHVIIVNKAAGEIVQGDKTGDRTLADEVKAYIKQKYNKPGEVFLGTVHRLDRPVSGLVVFARTSKALTPAQRNVSAGRRAQDLPCHRPSHFRASQLHLAHTSGRIRHPHPLSHPR